MKHIVVLFAAIVTLIALLVVLPTSTGAFLDRTNKSLDNKNVAADFALKDMNGKVVQLSKLKGKIVLINFWASWCSPCIEEVPMLNEIAKQYQNKGVQIIGASLDRMGFMDVRRFLDTHKITPNYPMIVANHLMINAYKNPSYLPTTYIIDGEGIIRKESVGAMSRERITLVLDDLLSER